MSAPMNDAQQDEASLSQFIADEQKSTASTDANDYSRFNDVEFSDADSDDDTPAALPSTDIVMPIAESIAKANTAKDAGNTAFKTAQYVEAKLHYQSALQLVLPHKGLVEPAVSAQERQELRALLVSLLGNTSMVLMKQEEWTGGAKSASSVLDIEPDNVKGLFRRGSCHHHLGNLAASRADLQRAVELDPTNGAARKELVEVTRALKEKKNKEKASYAGAFSKGASMYADREQERLVKAKKAADAAVRDQDEWTQSKLSRRESGLEEQTFDQWKKERDEQAKKKAEEKKATPPPATATPTATPSIPRGPSKTASKEEEEYDEEDAKLIKEATGRGYCYFRNQLDTETTALIGDIKPKALTTTNTDAPAISTTIDDTTATTPVSDGVGVSDWNHAGTWEERDFSALVKSRLTEICLSCTFKEEASSLPPLPPVQSPENQEGVESSMDDTSAITDRDVVRCTVKEVKKCDGEAQVVMTRGKKRHLYDYQVDVQFEARCGKGKYTGKISFVDVTPGGDYEHSITYQKAVADKGLEKRVKGSVHALRDVILAKLKSFEIEYKSM